jgi:hypothetical protein
MTFAQLLNLLTTHLSERISVVKRRMTVLLLSPVSIVPAMFNVVLYIGTANNIRTSGRMAEERQNETAVSELWVALARRCRSPTAIVGSPRSRVRSRPKPSDFSGWKNSRHAFLRRGSKIICPMSKLWGMKKNPALFVNSEIAGQIPLVPSFVTRVRCVSG